MAEAYKIVTFSGVNKTYVTNTDIECTFNIKTPYQPTKYDWIGLFRVPWSSIKDSSCYQYVAILPEWLEDKDKEGSVVFSSSSLPGEDGEYYQFVYFDGQKHMRGTSSPFTFRQPQHYDELVEEVMEDDSDMLFITTRQTQLEKQVTELKTEKDIFEKKCHELELTRQTLVVRLEGLECLVESETDKKAALEKEIFKLQQSSESEKADHNAVTAKYIEVCQEIEERAKEIEKLLGQVTPLRNEVDSLNGVVVALKAEKELYSNQITEAENKAKALQDEVSELRSKLEVYVNTADDVNALMSEIEAQNDKVAQAERVTKSTQKELEALKEQHERSVTEVATLHETLRSMTGRYEAANNKLADLKQEKVNWEEVLESKSKEVNHLLSTIATQQQQLDQLSKDEHYRHMGDDRFVALRESYGLVKEELARTQKNLDAKTKHEKLVRDSEKVASRRVKELEERLKEGEMEWRKISKRNAELEMQLSQQAVRPRTNHRTHHYRSPSGAEDDAGLSREELLKMVQDQAEDMSKLREKKNKYREKFLAEKQRIATIREDFRMEKEKLLKETERLMSELSVARSQLSTRDELMWSTDSIKYPHPEPPVGLSIPIIYPSPVQKSSFDPELVMMGPCPDQVETKSESGQDTSDDEDNNAERFHDTVEGWPSENPPASCCMCHVKFDPSDDVTKREEHVNLHLMSIKPDEVDSSVSFTCPMCHEVFEKSKVTQKEYENHVERHFN